MSDNSSNGNNEPPRGNDDFHRVERLFQEAADLPAGQRAEYLERECAGDSELRAQVDRLLERLGETLDIGGGHAAPFPAVAITEGPGTVIGRYKLLQVIGEGGFGIVYMAEQTEPVVRKVALKIIKLGMDTREVVARFEAERQALALMDHPNIARVLDGGSTNSGRPYFVMELVRGVSVTEFADKNNLDTNARLQLFLKVCQAVQHAHQKGVIHRDLKPSNVMVTLHDGQPTPKVIDFGVAKAMHTKLTEKTLFTHYEQFVGTPAYMSPEQAELSGLDVDTRTDIYSLGVLLYELLTGTTPFDSSSLMKAGIAEIQRVIREEEPPRPSIRVSTTGGAAVTTERGGDVATLGRSLRGDLDWIVMKALEKDRSRRYDDAGAFADDIRRHLEREPVTAGPPSTTYRLRKFLARNRTPVIAALLVTVALCAGIVATTVAMLQAVDNSRLASNQADRALAALDFLLSTLALANPEVALNPDVTVVTLLDHTAQGVEEAFGEFPAIEARVRATIGCAYVRLNEYHLAEPHLRRVVELVDAEETPSGQLSANITSAGFNELEFYVSLWSLVNVCFNLERDDAFAAAARSRRFGHDYLGQSHPQLAAQLRELASTIESNAWSLEEDAMDAVPEIFERAMHTAESALPPGDPRWPIVWNSLLEGGYTVWHTRHEPMGEMFWSKALEVQRRELPANHPEISVTVNLLVGLLNKGERLAESETLLRESLKALRTVHREDSYTVAITKGMLAETLTLQGRFEEAEPILLESHEKILETVRDATNWIALESFVRVVGHYEAAGTSDKANVARQALAHAGSTSEYLLQWAYAALILNEEQAVLRDAGNAMEELTGGVSLLVSSGTQKPEGIDAAIELFTSSLEQLDVEDPRRAVLSRLCVGWANGLDPDEQAHNRLHLAEAARRTLVHWKQGIPLDYAEAMILLAEGARARRKLDVAKDHAHEAWRAIAENLPTGGWYIHTAHARIARGLIAEGMFSQAEKLLLSAFEVIRAQLGEQRSEYQDTRQLLHTLYRAWGRPQDAAQYIGPP